MRTRSASYNASGFSEFTGELLGQIYDPDSQCEAVNGKGSYMCRVSFPFLINTFSAPYVYQPTFADGMFARITCLRGSILVLSH